MSNHDISSPPEAGIHSERAVWGPWATLGFGIVVIVISTIAEGLVGVVFVLSRAFTSWDLSLDSLQFKELADAVASILSSNLGLLVALATIVSAVVCVAVIVAIVKVRRSVGVAGYLAFQPISGRNILVVLAVMLGFIILSDCLSILLERPVYPDFMMDVYRTSVWPALLWIALIIFAPAFEETLFRGFLFEGFRQSRLGIIGAIGLTSLFWALLHVQYDVYEIAVIFVMGILFGIVRLKTGSLWSTLIMHAFANLVATLELVLRLNDLIS
jgi:membrane protease YdiL (CAAX protease family)